MTDRVPTEWSDDRLNAAFRHRADARATPGDLVRATIDRVRSVERAPRHRRLVYLGGLVGAASVAAIAILLVARPAIDRTGDDGLVQGLPILTVSEAIAVRDGGPDDREIAVSGFLGAGPVFFCAFNPAPLNPTELRCSQSWLMERPESLLTVGVGESVASGRNPTGPALSPSFALVDAPPGHPLTRDGNSTPSAVVLIGHFDDRRAVMCPADSVPACTDTFVVDRVESVEGARTAANVRLDLDPLDGRPARGLTWKPDEVAARLLSEVPNLTILSQVAVASPRVGELEPSLGTGALGIIDRREIVWLVTGLEATTGGQEPARRAFLIVDGTAEAYEAVPFNVDNVGFVPFTLVGTPFASDEPSATAPSPSPTPFGGPANAPAEVLGLPVISVSDALARIRGEFDDTELAVRGYYVPPSRVISCKDTPADANPLRQSCSTASQWLMDAPEQLEDPTTGERRAPTSPALNPIIPGGVPFPLGNPGFEPAQSPLPVVVLGHFADRRSHEFDAAKQFVVDALLWRSGTSISLGGFVEPISQVETTADVTERIERVLGPARAIWFGLVTPNELADTDPDAVQGIPDLKTASAVWLVHRLVEEDGRAVVRTAFTVEGSDRVWTDEAGGGFFLETTIDVDLAPGVILKVVDNAGEIRNVRLGELAGAASWLTQEGPTETGPIQVGVIAERPNELRVSWRGGDCDRIWRLDWSAGNTLFLWPSERFSTCGLGGTRREIVLTLDHPVDLEAIYVSNGGAGG